LLSGVVSSLMIAGNRPINEKMLIAALGMKSTIQGLSLSSTGITEPSSVFRALRNHPSLTIVELGAVPLNESDRAELALLREQNPNLDVAVDNGVEDSQ